MTQDLRRPRWSRLVVTLAGVLLISAGAACGSSADDDADVTTPGAATSPTASIAWTPSGGMPTPTTAGSPGTDDEDMSAELGAVGMCFSESFTADVVADLRAGETGSAEDAFNACMEDTLPESLSSQLEPVVDEATDCAQQASEDLSDADMTALESGDQAVAQQLANDTLTCISDSLGIDLSGM